MGKFLTALLLVAALLAPSANAGPPPSIVPLQTAGGDNFCTTWSINQKQHLYVTANHCVDPTADPEDELPTPHMYTQRIVVWELNKDADLAVVKAALGAPALKLASEDPDITFAKNASKKDWVYKISVEGFPYGWTKITKFHGTLVWPHLHIVYKDGTEEDLAIFDMTAAPGNSGSPIFNEKHEVISVLQVGFRKGNITGGVVYQAMKNFLESYTE